MDNLARNRVEPDVDLEEISEPQPDNLVATLADQEVKPYLGNDFGGRLDLTFSWDRSKDRLARQMWMPKGMRSRNPALGQGKAASTRKTKPASTAAKVIKMKSKKATLTRRDSHSLKQNQDANLDLQRATDVLRSELGVKVKGDVPKLQVRSVPPPKAVVAELEGKSRHKKRPDFKHEFTRHNGSRIEAGRIFGKWIITLRRRQGKRSSQDIGKRLLATAKRCEQNPRNGTKGQLFYLSAAYGVLESR